MLYWMLVLLLASFERQQSRSPFISFLDNEELESTNEHYGYADPWGWLTNLCLICLIQDNGSYALELCCPIW